MNYAKSYKMSITLICYVFHEFISQQLLTLFFVCLIIPMYAGSIIGKVTIASYEKILIDSAFFSVQIFLLLYILLFILPFFSRQTKHNSYIIFFIAQNSRSVFFFGCITAFFTIACSCALLFFIVDLVVLRIVTQLWLGHLFWGYCSLIAEAFFLICSSIFFALATRRTLSFLSFIGWYVIAYTNSTLHMFTKKHGAGTVLAYIYYFLPNLSLIDLKAQAIHQLPIKLIDIIIAFVYIACWCCIFLCTSYTLFKKQKL